MGEAGHRQLTSVWYRRLCKQRAKGAEGLALILQLREGSLGLLLLAAACSGESTGPSYEEFFVAPFTSSVDASGAPAIFATVTVQVTDTGGTAVHGALVRFKVSTGSATPTQITSGTGGFTDVSWTLVAVSGHTEELTACASNFANRCDTYYPVLTLAF